MAELVARAKEKPDTLSYASAGIGTTPHLAGEWLKSITGIKITHVPYGGAGPALQAILAGTVPLMCASLVGSGIGATLLLTLPASAFKAIVPVFIGAALVLIVLQPRISRWLAAHGGGVGERAGPAATAGVFAAGVYGGYFGAAQGILVLSILSLAVDDSLKRLNALKVVLVGIANLVSGLVFVFAAHVAWAAAGLIASGSVIGGLLGARVGRRLSPEVLRGVIVVVGVVAIVRLLA